MRTYIGQIEILKRRRAILSNENLFPFTINVDDVIREPVEHCDSDSEQTAPPSPGDRGINDMDTHSSKEGSENWDMENKNESENWDNDEVTIVHEEPFKHYFNMVNRDEDIVTKQRSLTILVDKRITLEAFKAELEPFIGTDSENLKLNIKFGRALRQGEYRVKVFQLDINEAEPSKFLIDTIFAKGMTVLESKKLIIPEIKEQCGLKIPVHSHMSSSIFVHVIDEEQMISSSQLAIFVRQWHPATVELENFKEIFLTQQTVEELKSKISEVSGILEENIDYAKGRGNFPCDVSLFEMNTDLDWSPHTTTLNTWPLYICDDGSVLFYKDKTGKPMELSEEQKKELQQKENAR
ncbi:USP47 [Mytilus coruscus]|uniref:USP47 n=1 Tax=Mytilus coruscus TaxID=42192 RepID=A0A6J8CAA8_MYTCO|nr:USP47 [Mytilus coruscus]